MVTVKSKSSNESDRWSWVYAYPQLPIWRLAAYFCMQIIGPCFDKRFNRLETSKVTGQALIIMIPPGCLLIFCNIECAYGRAIILAARLFAAFSNIDIELFSVYIHCIFENIFDMPPSLSITFVQGVLYAINWNVCAIFDGAWSKTEIRVEVLGLLLWDLPNWLGPTKLSPVSNAGQSTASRNDSQRLKIKHHV